MIIFETPRLIVQRYTMDDADEFFALNSDKEVMRYIRPPKTREENINALELERIYLVRSATGKGIGKKIIDYMTEIAKEKGKKLIWLKVMDSSKGAISVYKKMGFEICGTAHLNFEMMKPQYRGMYVMKKLL